MLLFVSQAGSVASGLGETYVAGARDALVLDVSPALSIGHTLAASLQHAL